MIVRDILSGKKRRGTILQVQESEPAATALAMLVENDTGSVAVYRAAEFLGMLTFRELLRCIHRGDDLTRVASGDIVEEKGACATPDDSVDQVRNIMTSNHIRYLPVIDGGKVTDIISLHDVARSAAKAADFENRLLKQYIGNWPGDEEGEGGNP